MSPVLAIRLRSAAKDQFSIDLRLEREGQAPIESNASIDFKLLPQEQEDLRWYMEDYLQHPEAVEAVHINQIIAMMRQRGEDLYDKVFAANRETKAIWSAIREQIADLRIEINTDIAEAAAIPWELMHDRESGSALAVRVKAFVRVQSTPKTSFVQVSPAEDGRIRLLYIACRPGGTSDVALRVVANRLLQGLEQTGKRQQFDIVALRPPTYEQLKKTLADAKQAGRPFHIVHFDGHGVYADLSETWHANWPNAFKFDGKHGYLLFEQPLDEDKTQPVPGEGLGELMYNTGVPLLVLNACQSAMHNAQTVHDEIRAIGSLAQAVVNQGIPAVLGMRYRVLIASAAQYIGELFASLAKGQSFGEATTQARRHLCDNPERWAGLSDRPLPDWIVPVAYETMPLTLPQTAAQNLGEYPELDPAQRDESLRCRIPEQGYIGCDETLLLLDRAFDDHTIVLLYAYAGQGKTSAAVEFARWYAQTGGLNPSSPTLLPQGEKGWRGGVLLTSFEIHVDLEDALNQLAHLFKDRLEALGVEWYTLKPEQRRNRALQLLRTYPLLWIWDSVEPVAGFPAGTESAWTSHEQAELADFLKELKLDQSTQVKLLLTSRRDEQTWLGGIPHRVLMPGMSRDDSGALALAICKSRGWQHIGGWGPLLDYCTGNPLTLRVLAEQAISMGLRGRAAIEPFIKDVHDGKQEIEDADKAEGRDHSLRASLAYGYRNAFTEEELPVIALLALFQGVVDVAALVLMGQGDCALEEIARLNHIKTISAPKVDSSPVLTESLKKLLDRACDIGLLSHLVETWYVIHPALPWFLRPTIKRYYPMTNGLFNKALRAWVEAIGELGDKYHDQFEHGNLQAIEALRHEERNLLHARLMSLEHSWWDRVISMMQGLRMLYQYEGRYAEWKLLVEDIVKYYFTAEDLPIPNRGNDSYSLVMEYRVDLAQKDKNTTLASELVEKWIKWIKSVQKEASEILSLPDEVLLDEPQRHLIRQLAVAKEGVARTLCAQGKADCITYYKNASEYHHRLGDSRAEAIVYYNIGHAYKDVFIDLEQAETFYRRSLNLHDPRDNRGLSKCYTQLGLLEQKRYFWSIRRGEPSSVFSKHLEAAEIHLKAALKHHPKDENDGLGLLHGLLGWVSTERFEFPSAQNHFVKSVSYYMNTEDYLGAGHSHHNLASMYWYWAKCKFADHRDLLHRARVYAKAALRDYSHYQSCAASEAAKEQTQQLIAAIDRALSES